MGRRGTRLSGLYTDEDAEWEEGGSCTSICGSVMRLALWMRSDIIEMQKSEELKMNELEQKSRQY